MKGRGVLHLSFGRNPWTKKKEQYLEHWMLRVGTRRTYLLVYYSTMKHDQVLQNTRTLYNIVISYICTVLNQRELYHHNTHQSWHLTTYSLPRPWMTRSNAPTYPLSRLLPGQRIHPQQAGVPKSRERAQYSTAKHQLLLIVNSTTLLELLVRLTAPAQFSSCSRMKSWEWHGMLKKSSNTFLSRNTISPI